MAGVTKMNLYFVSVDKPSEKLEIQFVPNELTVTRNPTYASVFVIGRNTPHYLYGSGDTKLEFQLDFFSADQDRKDVIAKCRWLEAFGYNDPKAGKAPSKIMLVYGDLFKTQLWVVLGVKYKLKQFSKPNGYLPQQAYVDITLGLAPKNNLTQEDVRRV